jgi:hypothetical protein
MKTYTGEDIIAVAVRHTNGRVNYFLTLGKFYWQAELAEIAKEVLSRATAFALDGEPLEAEVCYSVGDAAEAPYFFEHFFALCRLQIPDYQLGDQAVCDAQALRIHDEIRAGGHLYYCGSSLERAKHSTRFWSMRTLSHVKSKTQNDTNPQNA